MANKFVTPSIACATCGAVRGSANHWFVLTGDALHFPLLYSVRELDPVNPPTENDEFPACGESCLQKLESKLLSGKKLCAA